MGWYRTDNEVLILLQFSELGGWKLAPGDEVVECVITSRCQELLLDYDDGYVGVSFGFVLESDGECA